MALLSHGSVLGVDVGCSAVRRSSAVCRLDWDAASVPWRIGRFRALDRERVEVIGRVAGDAVLFAAAFDGPLRAGLDLIGRYRTPERLLTRGLAPFIGKPGPSNTPVGRELNRHANACARAVLGLGRLAPAAHRHAIDEAAIVEAFPSAFLGLMIEDPKTLGTRRRDRSDVFYAHLAATGGLQAVLDRLLPGRRSADFAAVRNHDDRAAVVCALTALCVAAGDYTAVGDAGDGWIILPPRALIQSWAWEILEAGVEVLEPL
jgi:hypothetical protein